MTEAYIYTYVNKQSQKTYIGSRSRYTTTAQEDFNIKYKSSSKNKEFLNDMQSGLLEGQIILIINCENAPKKIVELEHKMIKEYWNKFGKSASYNHYCNGKFSMAGSHHSQELCEKWSVERQGERNPAFGRKLTEEQKEHLRQFKGEKASKYGKKESIETRIKKSKALKGREFTEEQKKKLSQAQRNKVVSEETKLKISKATKGRKKSQETKRKISEAFSDQRKKQYAERMAEYNKTHIVCGRVHSEETKKKIQSKNKGLKRQKYVFIDTEGCEHLMTRCNAQRWHPDWIEKM